MRIVLFCFAIVAVFMDDILANPLLLDNMPTTRTLFQQNMKCNTKSAFKRITMSNTLVYNTSSQSCDYGIRAYSLKVCQLRVDITYLDMQQPTSTGINPGQHTSCRGDRLSINGLNFDLCGRLVGQHVYVPFDVKRLTDEVILDLRVSANAIATWIIEVNQIECGHKAALVTPDEREAPTGCLQYFYQPNGRIDSFNDGPNGYYGDTKYAICFNRNYNENARLELSEITFQMAGTGTAGFDADCLDPDVGATSSKDYIAIPFAEVTTPREYHSLFCLDSLNNNRLEYRGTGPIVIHVNTDQTTTDNTEEKGFSFRYRITN